MSQYFNVIAVSTKGDLLGKVAQREGVITKSLTMKRGVSPIRDMISIIRMYTFLSKVRPDIIHSHTPKAGLVSMIAGYLSGVPIRMHTVAGMPLESRKGLKRKLLLFAERLTYRFATRVYANSYGIERFIIDNRLMSINKLGIIRKGSSNGIDSQYFARSPELESNAVHIRKQLGIDKETFVFGFIGRLVRDKGINELISCFAELAKVNDIHLILVGKYENHLDPLSESSVRLIDELTNISFVGYQADVRPYFLSFDAFVFPSYREGLPNVLLQAAAMEVAILASDCTGNTDIVENEVNGLLFKTADEESLKKAMLRIITESERKNYIVSSRSIIENNYERQGLWNDLYSEYKELIKLSELNKSN
jgi:glycosyltransferase involved in cell wall biosynthesis